MRLRGVDPWHVRDRQDHYGPNSLQAKKNIGQICEMHLQGRCELTVVDVSQDFKTALEHGILIDQNILIIYL